jgi:hypothetical protein
MQLSIAVLGLPPKPGSFSCPAGYKRSRRATSVWGFAQSSLSLLYSAWVRFLFVPRARGTRALRAPARGGSRRLRARPGKRSPGRGPWLDAVPGPLARPVPARRGGYAAPARGTELKAPHPKEVELVAARIRQASTSQDHRNRGAAVRSVPRAIGAMPPERAGPRRAGWRGETARLSPADAEGPHAGKRCRVARGGVASAASEHRHPRGKKALYAVEKGSRLHAGRLEQLGSPASVRRGC